LCCPKKNFWMKQKTITPPPFQVKWSVPNYQTYLGEQSQQSYRIKLYDKRDDFNFPIVNFPFLSSNIPAAPAYGVYIFQLIQYSRACGSYHDFHDRGLLLTRKLLKHEFLWLSWSYHFKSFMVATMTWLTVMEYLCHKWLQICSVCRNHNQDAVIGKVQCHAQMCIKLKNGTVKIKCKHLCGTQ
jgi:hypothetical protein